MATGTKVLYEFGPFWLDPEKQVLLRGDQPVAITPKIFETLLVLVRHSGEIVSKDELMKELWPDAFVEEANLSQNIFMLRKALGDTPEDRRYIVTLPGRGYRFVAEVREVVSDGGDVIIASHSQLVVEQSPVAPSDAVPALPAGAKRKFGWKHLVSIAALVGLLITAAVVFLHRRRIVALGEKDFVLIADFTNTTGDPVFDGTLRQGLAVQLEQSPFLSLVSDKRIQQTLRLMGQPPDARVTPEIAREVCERTGSAAVLDGSITSLGSRYVIGLRASNCRTGDVLADEQVQADRKEDVLNALGQAASRFRTRVGESLATVEKHNTPLAEATTPSLEALQAYSMGWKAFSVTGEAAAMPFFKRAIEIDPKFAMAYAALGLMYGGTGESALSADSTGKAYELRDRASDNERFFIDASYEGRVTGNLERAQQTCEAWAQTYPHEWLPHGYLSGFIYDAFGEYEKALEESKKGLQLDPDNPVSYDVLAYNYEYLDRLPDAEKALQLASQRGVEIPEYMFHRYDLAFLKGDKAGMAKEVVLAQGKSGAEDWIAYHEAFALAYIGQLQAANRMARRAVDLAQQSGDEERGALFMAGAAVSEAFLGNAPAAQRSAAAALAISKDREAEYGAALALVLSGNSSRAETLTNDLEEWFPEDTSVRFSYVPTLRALLALKRGAPERAIDLLQVSVPYELGAPRSSMHGFFGALYPVYVRGEAYLAAHQGTEAGREFQKILDHRGVVVSDPVGALAYLQLARAYELSGDSTKAKSEYQQFLALWRDADQDSPILRQAKTEYGALH